MSAVTGVFVGLAAAAGAVAIYRIVERRARTFSRALDALRRKSAAEGQVLEFEQDPATGVYRAK